MPSVPIKVARRRAQFAKRGLAFGSAVALIAAIGLARSSHPASAAKASTSTTTSVSTTTTTGRQAPSATGGFGQAEVSPATGAQAPSVSTSAS